MRRGAKMISREENSSCTNFVSLYPFATAVKKTKEERMEGRGRERGEEYHHVSAITHLAQACAFCAVLIRTIGLCALRRTN